MQGEAGAPWGHGCCVGACCSQEHGWIVFFPSLPPGLPISVVVNCTSLQPPGHLQEIELFNTSGHALLSLPMRPLSNTSLGQLWVGSLLRVPPGDFLLKVKGEDAQGHPLHRLSGVTYTSVVPGEWSPYSPKVPEAPALPLLWFLLGYFFTLLPSAALGELPRSVYMCACPHLLPGLPEVNISSKIQAYSHEPLLISCSAQSEVAFHLQLSRGSRKLGEEQRFR